MTATPELRPVVHASVVVRDRGKVLLVREGKPADQGRWNFPGGHVEAGETVKDAAAREIREEAGLGVYITDLVGVYTGATRSGVRSVRFVFSGHAVAGDPSPGPDILEVRWFVLPALDALPDEDLVAPVLFRNIVRDLVTGITWPVRVLSEEP